MLLAIGVVSVGWQISAGAAAAPLGHPAAPTHPAPFATPTVVSRSFAGTASVNSLASNRTTALLDVLFSNGTNRLVLFNAASNSTKVIQKFVPGGAATALISVTSAGGAFFLAWQNLTTGKEFFQKVTLKGVISTVSLPLSSTSFWTFVAGTSKGLYAAAGKLLLDVNPGTLALTANYSKFVPANVSVQSALPVGTFLYLAGVKTPAHSGGSPYLGFVNLTAHKTTTITKTRVVPTNETGVLLTLMAFGTSIYAGGYLSSVSAAGNFSIVGGYLDRYTPATNTFTNQSSFLPVKRWAVWALEPWNASMGLSLSGYGINPTTGALVNFGGGIYTLTTTGTHLVNETSLFPKGYLAFIFQVTGGSGGWFFSGGFNTVAGVGEVVAVKP